MESYNGYIRTQVDAILLFEACRLGFLPRNRRRLSERERLQIGSGCIYVWEENEASMKRWTDGKSWSASRVSGSFLTYREMEGNKRGTVAFMTETKKRKSTEPHASRSSPGSAPETDSDDSDGYQYKLDGLFKQSFSITTSTNLKLHLIAYYTKADVTSGKLTCPSADTRLKKIQIPNDLYPDTSVSGSSLTSPVTTTPLVYAPYPTLPTLPPLPKQKAESPQPKPKMEPVLPPLDQLADSVALLPRLKSQPVDSFPYKLPAIKHDAGSTKLPVPKVLAEDHRALGMLNRVFI